jgi:hypothetical protein
MRLGVTTGLLLLNNRIALFPFFHRCRKRRLKDLIALTLEIDCDQMAIGSLPVTSVVLLIAK